MHWRTGDTKVAVRFSASVGDLDEGRFSRRLARSERSRGHVPTTGRFAAARRHYDQSLAIKEKTYGPDHPEVALVLFNTANLMREMGDFADARRLYERALRIREDKLGRTHTLTAYALNGLGEALMKSGHTSGDTLFHARGLDLARLERSRPSDRIRLARGVVTSFGSFEASLNYYDRAQAIYERTFGPEYPDVAILHSNSASVLSSSTQVRRGR